MKDTTIKTLIRYFGNAIRKNVGNVEEMKKAILATLYHCVLTDLTLQDQLCSQGPDSWCLYELAVIKNKLTVSHKRKIKTLLNQTVYAHLLSIYERLSDILLLKRCTKGLT